MELLAVFLILLLTLAVAYVFGKVTLDTVMAMMVRGEEVTRRISQ